MEKAYTEHKGIYSNLTYYLVFCPRYRRKIFSNKRICDRFAELVEDICSGINAEISFLLFGDDHVYMEVKALPETSPNAIVRAIKSGTTNPLRSEFTELSAMTSLWTRAYMASTEKIEEKEIELFLKQQKTRL